MRALVVDVLERAKERGEIWSDADSRIIAENISGMNSGLSDMRRYFSEGYIKMSNASLEVYTERFVNEYISSLRKAYKKS